MPFFQLELIDTRVAFQSDPIDLTHWFEIESNNTIYAFLSNDDGMFHKRKEGFLRHLYAVADSSSLQSFKNSIACNLFSTKYMSEHRWPHLT